MGSRCFLFGTLVIDVGCGAGSARLRRVPCVDSLGGHVTFPLHIKSRSKGRGCDGIGFPERSNRCQSERCARCADQRGAVGHEGFQGGRRTAPTTATRASSRSCLRPRRGRPVSLEAPGRCSERPRWAGLLMESRFSAPVSKPGPNLYTSARLQSSRNVHSAKMSIASESRRGKSGYTPRMTKSPGAAAPPPKPRTGRVRRLVHRVGRLRRISPFSDSR